MKFYKRDPDAAIAGMAELTLEERGAYNTIIDQAYSRDGILRDDDRMLARMMGVHILKWRCIRIRLMQLGKIWVEGNGCLGVTRVNPTLEEARQFSKRQADKAAIRWEKHRRINGDGHAKAAMPPTPTPTPTKKERKKETHSEGGKGRHRVKPRHGCKTKDGSRIWLDRGTSDWNSYAEAYAARHAGMAPPTQWNGSGTWFNLQTGDA